MPCPVADKHEKVTLAQALRRSYALKTVNENAVQSISINVFLCKVNCSFKLKPLRSSVKGKISQVSIYRHL